MKAESVLYKLQLDPNQSEPIYLQLYKQVERLVLSGQLKTGDTLPSVRKVAEHFQVNPMTISKAYSQLEVKGIVNRLRGRGMQVAEGVAGLQSDALIEQLDSTLIQLIRQAEQLNLSTEQIIERFNELQLRLKEEQ